MIKEIWQKDKSVCICKEFGLEKEIRATQKLSGHVTHTHTHTLSDGGRAHLSFSFSLVSVLLEQRLKERRGHEREHAVLPFTQDFFGKEIIIIRWCFLASCSIVCVSAATMADRFIRR